MSAHPRSNAQLQGISLPDPQWLPEDIRPLAAEGLKLRKMLSEAEVALGYLERASTRDAAIAEDQRLGAEAVREGKAPPKVSALQRHEAALVKARQDRESVKQAVVTCLAEYDVAMRAALPTALPAAEADYLEGEAEYRQAIEALEAARHNWLLRQRVFAMWVNLARDPERASVSLNTHAATNNQAVRIGHAELTAGAVTQGMRDEIAKASKVIERQRRDVPVPTATTA